MRTKEQFEANLGLIKWVITGLGLWFALYQIVPLYVGWRMLTENDDDDVRPVAVTVAAPPDITTETDLNDAADRMVAAAEEMTELKE